MIKIHLVLELEGSLRGVLCASVVYDAAAISLSRLVHGLDRPKREGKLVKTTSYEQLQPGNWSKNTNIADAGNKRKTLAQQMRQSVTRLGEGKGSFTDVRREGQFLAMRSIP